MRSRDTSEAAAAVQARLHDALGPDGRADLALKMSDFAREFAKAALRRRFPDYSEDQITFELTTRLHGRSTPGEK